MANATYLLSIIGTCGGEFCENVMAFQGDLADGSNTYAESQDLVEAFQNAEEVPWLACLPATYQLRRYEARIAEPAKNSNRYHRDRTPDNKIGTAGSAAQSDNLCPSISLIPPMGIKSAGRVFMPSIDKTSIANNQYTSGYIADLHNVFDDMIAGFTASTITWKLAIFSRKTGTSSRAQATVISPAIGFQGKRRKPL